MILPNPPTPNIPTTRPSTQSERWNPPIAHPLISQKIKGSSLALDPNNSGLRNNEQRKPDEDKMGGE